MFEVAWCVMLYTTVLSLEFLPILFERLGWQKAIKISKAITVPLVGIGFILSTLHQSSLGSLYLILRPSCIRCGIPPCCPPYSGSRRFQQGWPWSFLKAA